MKAKILLEIDNCSKCPFHEKHQIKTIDSSDYDIGIYCSISEAPEDEEWSTNTSDAGKIKSRLIVADDFLPDEFADVPKWCPYVFWLILLPPPALLLKRGFFILRLKLLVKHVIISCGGSILTREVVVS